MKKEVLLFSSFPDYAGNSKALYEYLKKQKTKMELIWVSYDEKNKEMFEEKKIPYVLYKSKEYVEAMKRVTVIFDTNGALIKEKQEGQYYINLWHGFGPKIGGYFLTPENMAPQDFQYLHDMEENTDYIIVPSLFWQATFSALFHVNMHRILPLGLARCDSLYQSNGKENLEKILPFSLKGYRKIIGYLPTFRKGCGRVDGEFTSNIFNFPAYKEKELLSYLEKEKILLVVKLHPSELQNITKVNHPNVYYLEEKDMTSQGFSVYDILNAFDLLISDYSSIYIEFLLLNRPVLFVHPDYATYQEKRNIIFENKKFWFPGPSTVTIQELLAELPRLLKEKEYYQEEREQFVQLMYVNEKKDNCKRLVNTLFEKDHLSSKLTRKQKSKEDEEKLERELLELQKKTSFLEEQNQELRKEKGQIEEQLERIYHSRSWKLIQSLKKVGGKKNG